MACGKACIAPQDGNAKRIYESVEKMAHIVPENFDDVKELTAGRVCFRIRTHHNKFTSICQTIDEIE